MTPITQIPPIRKIDGSCARDTKDKAQIFANYLEDIFTPNEMQPGIENPECKDITLVTPKEVAARFDLIPGGEVLKQLPRKDIVLLTYHPSDRDTSLAVGKWLK